MQISEFHPNYISLVEQGDVVVAAFAVDQFSDDDNVETLGRELFTLPDQFDARKVILSLHNVTRVTSSVLGKLITLHRKLHRHAGKLIVCNMTDEVERVVKSTKLWEYFHIADDLDAAFRMLA